MTGLAGFYQSCPLWKPNLRGQKKHHHYPFYPASSGTMCSGAFSGHARNEGDPCGFITCCAIWLSDGLMRPFPSRNLLVGIVGILNSTREPISANIYPVPLFYLREAERKI